MMTHLGCKSSQSLTSAAVDTLVVIGRAWDDKRMQEVLFDYVEKKVIDHIVDRIDDIKYDPIAKIEKISSDVGVDAKERDFVKDLIEKERKFNLEMGIGQNENDSVNLSVKESGLGVRMVKIDQKDKLAKSNPRL